MPWTADGISSTLPSLPCSPPSPSSTVIDRIGTPAHFLCFHSDSRSYLVCDRHTSTISISAAVQSVTKRLRSNEQDPQALASRKKQATSVRIAQGIQDGPVRCRSNRLEFKSTNSFTAANIQDANKVLELTAQLS